MHGSWRIWWLRNWAERVCVEQALMQGIKQKNKQKWQTFMAHCCFVIRLIVVVRTVSAIKFKCISSMNCLCWFAIFFFNFSFVFFLPRFFLSKHGGLPVATYSFLCRVLVTLRILIQQSMCWYIILRQWRYANKGGIQWRQGNTKKRSLCIVKAHNDRRK